MEDLVKKIQELRDLLKGMTPMLKPKQSLVPAIKAPTIKPIAVSSAPAAPSKIPGVAPTSNKDPVKMAQQLKNPRPKKPKMEILKSDKNGQWTIEKDESGINYSPDEC